MNFWLSLSLLLSFASSKTTQNNQVLNANYIPSTKSPPSERIFPVLSYSPTSNSLLVFSGHSNSNYLNDLWAFSLDTFTWTIQRSFSQFSPDPRSGSGGFSSIFSSKFYIFGGVTSKGIVNDFWEFDLDTKKWNKIKTDTQPSPRQQFAYCNFNDGVNEYFVLYGGKTRSELSNELWVLNMTTLIWNKFEDNGESPGKMFSGGIQVYENNVYLLTGIEDFGSNAKIGFYKYDLSNKIWINLTTEDIFASRIYSQTALIGSTFYLFFGVDFDTLKVLNDVYKVDLNSTSLKWEKIKDESTYGVSRYSLTSVNNSVYFFGGSGSDPGTYYNTLVHFDTETSNFEAISNDTVIPAPRHFHSMVLISGSFYVFGGKNDDKYYNDLWKFDPNSEIWTPVDALGSIPSGRFGFAAASQGDAFAIWGGENQIGLNNELFQYNALTLTWQKYSPSGTSLPNPAKGACMVLSIPKIYIYGGITNSGYSNELWEYNLWTNLFTKVTSDISTAYCTCELYNGEFYVIFGSVLNSSPQTKIRKFNFTSNEWVSSFEERDTGFGSIQGIQLFHEGDVLKMGGQRLDYIVDTSIYVFNYNGKSVVFLKEIGDYTYQSAYTYYNYSIYVFGGGETIKQGLLLGYSTNNMWKLSMIDISKGSIYGVFCSTGTTSNNQTCELCKQGSYSDGIGNQTCMKCPAGTYNKDPGATSNRQCYPCDEGTFNDLEGQGICFSCPAGYLCPPGSTSPLDEISQSKYYSKQPKIYSENSVTDEILNWRLSFGLIGSFILLFILLIERTRDYLRKFDLFILLHNHFK